MAVVMSRVYALFPQSNESYAYRNIPSDGRKRSPHDFLVTTREGADFPQVRRCRSCGNILDKWNTPLNGCRVVRRDLDCGHTHDGVCIASQRFKNACERNGIEGIVFRPLPDDPEFCSVNASRAVRIDSKRRKVRFSRYCEDCEQYDEVVGATPVWLSQGERIAECECVRTDLEYACHDEKGFILLCGEQAAAALLSERLRGLVVQEQQQ